MFGITICGSYAVSQNNLLKNVVNGFNLLLLFFFFNPLLPLEVSLKLQLILKGNCLIKVCIWRLFWMQRYSIQRTCTKTQRRQMVFMFPVVQCCVALWNRRNCPSTPFHASQCSSLCHVFAYVVKIFEDIVRTNTVRSRWIFKTRTLKLNIMKEICCLLSKETNSKHCPSEQEF